MAIVLLAPVLPQMLADYAGVPGHEYLVPMILTVPALCVALLSPVAGMLGDYFGRRRLLIIALGIYAVVGLAPIFLTDLFAIIASRVLVGIAEAFIMVLTTTMIGDYFEGARRDKWLAAQTAVASVSALLFFNLGGILGSFGWRTPFWVYCSALIMLAAIVRFTWAAPAPSQRLHNASWDGFPWTKMLGIISVTIFASILFYTVQIQASGGLVALGLSNPAEIGFLTSIASLGVPLGTFIYSRITGTRVSRMLTIEFAILGVGFLLMSRATGTTSFLAGCAINQVGAGLLLPTLLVWAMSQLRFEVRGRGAGLWTGAFSLGQFLSPIVVTFSAAQTGGLLAAFGVLAIAAFIALAAAIFSVIAGPKPQPAHG
ncbi:MAG: MFS transporter [Proteobacteria bacterium]|nr:MFS transporter [Pseudomonadota bacterium]